MTTQEYLNALRELGLTPASKATAETLGLTTRQCQYLAKGKCGIRKTLAKLINELLNKRSD